MEQRTLMSGFFLRSLFQLYHSLTSDLKTTGKPLLTGCVVSSTFICAEVGPQVLLRKAPQPRNLLKYQSQSEGLVLNALTWKPRKPPPFSMYFWKPACCAPEG